jgi:hypothetical protein
LVKHDFTAFSKNLSSKERKVINELSNYFLKTINYNLSKENLDTFKFQNVSLCSLNDLSENKGDLIQLNSKISVFINKKLASLIMDRQLGSNTIIKDSDNIYSEGTLGKNVIIDLIKKGLNSLDTITSDIKHYNSVKEWELSQNGLVFITVSFEDKSKNGIKVLIDQMYKNWILSRNITRSIV